MSNKGKLVYGWGVNDVGYPVTRYELVDGKSKCVWTCPYYSKWLKMIERCFCPKLQKRLRTYVKCTVHEDWEYLSNFIKWVDNQPNKDWQNCDMDKDLLVMGNKHYSPETCVFVSKVVNKFVLVSDNSRGKCMLGVSISGTQDKPYMSRCSNPFSNKQIYLGLYHTEIEAHLSWQSYKHEIACLLAEIQPDPRVAKILRERYTPDKDWTKA